MAQCFWDADCNRCGGKDSQQLFFDTLRGVKSERCHKCGDYWKSTPVDYNSELNRFENVKIDTNR